MLRLSLGVQNGLEIKEQLMGDVLEMNDRKQMEMVWTCLVEVTVMMVKGC